MEETVVDPPPTIEAYLQRLDAVQASIMTCFQKQVEIVENTLRAKSATDNPAAAAAAADLHRVCHEGVSVLEVIEETGREFSKKVKGLGGVVSRHAKIDVGYLYEQGIGDIIRDFRPVSADTTQQALSNFVKGASNGDDFRLCLKAGADLNGLVEGQTALIKAVCANHTEVFEMILEDGADLEAKAGEVPEGVEGVLEGDTAVVVASCQGRWGMVRFLVAKGANVDAVGGDGRKALQVACEAADLQLDPDSVFDVNDRFRLHYDPQEGDPAVRSTVSEVLKELLAKTSDVADLKISARIFFERESLVAFFSRHEFEELLLLSLSRGVDMNADDTYWKTALMSAAARARPRCAQLLLDDGADVNDRDLLSHTALWHAVPSSIRPGNALACSAFRYPSRKRSGMQCLQVSVPETLWHAVPSGIRPGNPRTTEDGFITSVQNVCEILLDRGADVDLADTFGETPLHNAVLWGVTRIVQFLVDRGADLRLRNTAGQTPHDLAVQLSRSPECIALLLPPVVAD
uniref:Uncharacterized protein n=1 Tax=Chromera velia CCMP2878 TaxID=1169474 RepID=A0A0G4HBY7_9ALVE|eukprot:Cvel_6194.t1-p1 / transcript=Cvel_6194.t1 / gene=Cvel_6194 / organism=Chromera_velia_CCMP2878 / gene_product=Putative ankyrin repeat protein RF_0381, putative / transcript_product=Putative ankyrin repeat protein RF_0381, putative / location=Cvel_scaffold300:26497-28047(+) / protein_length=517 / sequence_SO=supercontig / SO=protein_coding / is_pseudo=false